MKIRTNIYKVLAPAVISILLFIGCALPGGHADRKEPSEEATAPYNAAFVLAIANNNPVVDVNRIEEFTNLTSCPGSTYCFVEADSTPDVIVDGTILDYTSKGYSESMMERIGSSVRLDLEEKITNTQPDAPGVDIAKAVELASRTLHSNRVEGRRDVLVIYASGICDTGTFNMVECPLCELDVERSVKDLSDVLNLNMEGIDVVWYCAADTAGQQGALNDGERETLTELYRGLFTAAHAESVTFREDLPPAGSYDFSQKVAVMRTEGDVSVLSAVVVDSVEVTSMNDTTRVFGEGGVIAFDEKQMAFKPDSVELSNPETALKALDYVIEYMDDREDFDLLIVGTTSSFGDDEEGSCRFSEERAASVRELLSANGIDQSRLHCVGCGYSVSDLYVPDRNGDGSLNEKLAARNRRVYLMDRNSEAARQVLAQMNRQ